MEWLRLHPYAAGLIGAGTLIVLGAFIVTKKTAVTPRDSTARVWSGVGAPLLNPAASAPLKTSAREDTLYTAVRESAPFSYIPIGAQIPIPETGTSNEFDFDKFLSMVSANGKSTPNGQATGVEENSTVDAYSFIPTGLLSTSTYNKNRSPKQQALFNYGNEAASSIQTHEQTYRNAPQILKDQFEDRGNPEKNDTLRALAASLSRVGDKLLAEEEVPSEVKTAHEKLAESYREMGAALSKVPDARGNEEFLLAILAYNTTVETFVKNYVALATLLSAYGVTFGPDDPGNIFTFTNASL